MTKQACSILLAFGLFAATALAQIAQPTEARTPSNQTPTVRGPSNGCRFQDGTYCDVFAQHPRSRINIPPGRQMRPRMFGADSGCRRGKRGLIGALAGAGIGATIGATANPKNNSRGTAAAQGAALLGLIGWAVGRATGCSH